MLLCKRPHLHCNMRLYSGQSHNWLFLCFNVMVKYGVVHPKLITWLRLSSVPLYGKGTAICGCHWPDRQAEEVHAAQEFLICWTAVALSPTDRLIGGEKECWQSNCSRVCPQPVPPHTAVQVHRQASSWAACSPLLHQGDVWKRGGTQAAQPLPSCWVACAPSPY